MQKNTIKKYFIYLSVFLSGIISTCIFMSLFGAGKFEGNTSKEWAIWYYEAEGRYEKLRDCVDGIRSLDEVPACRIYPLE